MRAYQVKPCAKTGGVLLSPRRCRSFDSPALTLVSGVWSNEKYRQRRQKKKRKVRHTYMGTDKLFGISRKSQQGRQPPEESFVPLMWLVYSPGGFGLFMNMITRASFILSHSLVTIRMISLLPAGGENFWIPSRFELSWNPATIHGTLLFKKFH